jgi:hypothetical protein
VRIPVETLPEVRRRPWPAAAGGEPLPASFLKHADEQTVAGLAAVFQAVHDHGLRETDFTAWGVLAAPRFLGRAAMAASLHRFRAEGAWGVSPHMIPHRSLHALSGTVSQALRIHGPNLGAGGGPGGVAEALLTAVPFLGCNRLPGVWLVLTALDPEQCPDDGGHPLPGSRAVGLALALGPVIVGPAATRLRLRVGPPGVGEAVPTLELDDLDALLRQLGTAANPREVAPRPLGAGLSLELAWDRGNGHGGTAPARAGGALGPWPVAHGAVGADHGRGTGD